MKLLDVLSEPWAILPAKKEQIDAIYATHLRGEKIDVKAVEAALGQPLNNESQGYDVVNGVAVFEIDGVIAKKMNLFTRISGGVSTEILARDFQQALDDPNVSSLLLRIESPGGAVDGVQQLADAIFAARGQKPIISLADGVMASAAYWIGAAADRVYAASDTTIVGSIGVVASHVDVSGAEAQRGVKTTEITAGKFKRAASQYAPLTQEGRQTIQDQIDHVYAVFLNDVAQFRGKAGAEAVHEEMADGRVFLGAQAVEAGLVDGVMPYEQLLAAMIAGDFTPDANTSASTRSASSGARAAVSAASADAPPHAAGDADGSIPSTQETTMAENATKTITAEDAKPFVDTALAEAQTAFEAKAIEFRAEGATAERARIQAVLAQQLPGHEALVQSLAFDGKTTGPEAAVAVLNAERGKLGQTKANLAADAPSPAPHAATPETDTKSEKKNEHPQAIAAKAQTYIAAQAKLGIKVSAAEAVAHVTANGQEG